MEEMYGVKIMFNYHKYQSIKLSSLMFKMLNNLLVIVYLHLMLQMDNFALMMDILWFHKIQIMLQHLLKYINWVWAKVVIANKYHLLHQNNHKLFQKVHYQQLVKILLFHHAA